MCLCHAEDQLIPAESRITQTRLLIVLQLGAWFEDDGAQRVCGASWPFPSLPSGMHSTSMHTGKASEHRPGCMPLQRKLPLSTTDTKAKAVFGTLGTGADRLGQGPWGGLA